MLQEAVRREEVAEHHGCSRPEERRIHKVAGGPAERCIDSEGGIAVDQEEHRTERVLRKGTVVQVAHRKETAVQVAHRMGIVVQEAHHMEMAREAHRKETAQGAHRRETELEAAHRKAIVQEAVVLGGKEGHRTGLKAEGQKA